jgi:hypothetical protein
MPPEPVKNGINGKISLYLAEKAGIHGELSVLMDVVVFNW